MKKDNTPSLYEAIKEEIIMLNDDLDYDEQLTKKQVKEATKRFLNGNYIGECINTEILNIMEDIRNEK